VCIVLKVTDTDYRTLIGNRTSRIDWYFWHAAPMTGSLEILFCYLLTSALATPWQRGY